MNRQINLAIAIVALVIGLTTFALARHGRGQDAVVNRQAQQADRESTSCDTCNPRIRRSCAVDRWLSVTSEQRRQIQQLDPDFYNDVVAQRELLAEQRDRLATLLEDTDATNEEITEQVERSIALGNDLERRVTKHLLLLRKILTPDQQKRLFGLAASGVRRRMAWCGRGCGRCGDDDLRPGRGAGQRRGGSMGQGRNRPGRADDAARGYGRGRGDGRGRADGLQRSKGQGRGNGAGRNRPTSGGSSCEGCGDQDCESNDTTAR